MLINIQYEEAAQLLFDLLEALPEETRPKFFQQVNAIASELRHPNLERTVVLPYCSNGTFQPSSTF